MQIKTTRSYHLTAVRVTAIKKTRTRVGEDGEKRDPQSLMQRYLSIICQYTWEGGGRKEEREREEEKGGREEGWLFLFD